MKVIHKDDTDKRNVVEIPCGGSLLGLPHMSIGATLPDEAITAGWRVLEEVARGPDYKASEWVDDGLSLREVAVDYSPEELTAQREAEEARIQAEQQVVAELDAQRIKALADKIGPLVQSLQRHLSALGYGIPCDAGLVMLDVVHRSDNKLLSATEEQSKRDLADVWFSLVASGVTNADIEKVWANING